MQYCFSGCTKDRLFFEGETPHWRSRIPSPHTIKIGHNATMTGVEREGRFLTPFHCVRNDKLSGVQREGVRNWALRAQFLTPSTIKKGLSFRPQGGISRIIQLFSVFFLLFSNLIILNKVFNFFIKFLTCRHQWKSQVI